MKLSIDHQQSELIERALNMLRPTLNETGKDACNEILDAITKERGCGGAAYIISLDCPKHWTADLISTAIQMELFGEGAVIAGYYDPGSVKPAPAHDGRWQFELLREDCEADYHQCYDKRNGHDGSAEDAIMQVQGEIDDSIEDAALTSNYRVEARRRL